MKYILPAFTAAFAVLLATGCASLQTGASSPAASGMPADTSKPVVHVAAKLLSYRDIQDFAEKHPDLNERLLTLAPSMAYHQGQAKPDVIPLVADAAAYAAKELLTWLGNQLEAVAKEHSATFASFVQQPAWWSDGQPDVAAVELTRTEGKGADAETVFDALVIIRPVFSSISPSAPKLAAFQLVPVYLLETKAAAKDFGNTLGAVLSVTLESSWNTDKGVPTTAVIATYSDTIRGYEIGKPVLIAAQADSDAKAPAATPEFKLSDASHFFAMPEQDATIGVTFGVAETDPSQWVGLLEKLGEAIGGEAADAGTAVKSKLSSSN